MNKITMSCPLCGTELKIAGTSTVSEIVVEKATRGDSVNCVRVANERRTPERLKERGIDPDKKYHYWVCYECGFVHNGIKNMREVL